MVVWMQRHKRWSTFAKALKGDYGVKGGVVKGHTFTKNPLSGQNVLHTAPRILSTSPLTGTGTLHHLFTDIKHLF